MRLLIVGRLNGQLTTSAKMAMSTGAKVAHVETCSAAFDPEVSAARVAQALEEALAAEGFHAESLNHPNTGHSHEADHG